MYTPVDFCRQETSISIQVALLFSYNPGTINLHHSEHLKFITIILEKVY